MLDLAGLNIARVSKALALLSTWHSVPGSFSEE